MGGLQFIITFTEAYGSFYMRKMKCVFGDYVTKYGPFLTIGVLFSEISEAAAAATSLTDHQHCQMHLGRQSNGYRQFQQQR